VITFSVSASFREKVLNLWRKNAGDKGIMRKMNDASFAQAISMGLSSGLPLEETMELAAEVLSDVPEARERCLNCKEELLSGIPLADALKKAEVFPPAMCRLLSLGMQSGNGDVVMVEIADRLSEEADVALASKVEKLEPTLVLITSVLVGIILLSVMLPLMNIMEAIG
jgi:type IV pilus assembly protein PilC